ncbi:hypothetical protein [Noviherbaspirillum malthae]|jgi:hypothetical protein|uniref:hypothetical protein n=1 Tax=Noviherbaspirillum malthae TaxID=1260987 RepID=UPI00189035AE|nr:hypothetical protein [Noviherbaspirillum malthae]
MKQLVCLIIAFAGAAACGLAAGQEPGSRESSGVIKPPPHKPSSGHIGTQGTSPVPEPAPDRTSSSRLPGFCVTADSKARDADNELRPASEGRVVGKGRLHFHTAPEPGCQSRNRFIIPGDAVIARRRHGEWLLIDYVSRDGVMHSAWVNAVRIHLTESAAKP